MFFDAFLISFNPFCFKNILASEIVLNVSISPSLNNFTGIDFFLKTKLLFFHSKLFNFKLSLLLSLNDTIYSFDGLSIKEDSIKGAARNAL